MLFALDIEPWQAAVGAASVAGVGLVGVFSTGVRDVVAAVFRLVLAWLERRESRAKVGREEYRLGIKGIVEWSEIIESIQALPYVDRVLLFNGANGGGVPKRGSPYYVRCIGGWPHTAMRQYKGPLVPDTGYYKFLDDLLSMGYIPLTTANMTDGDMLKDFYTDEGVVQSLAFKLGLTDKEFTYCTVASYKAPFKPAEIAKIAAIAHQVRGLLGST